MHNQFSLLDKVLWKEGSYAIILNNKAIKLDVKTAIRNPSQISILLTTSNHSPHKLECCNAKSLGYQLFDNKRVNGRKHLWKEKQV